MTTILVVDDTAMFRSIMSRYLTELGIKMLELDSGIGVNELIASEEIDAIILDILMEKKEGIEVILELLKLPKRPKIIAVSSNAIYLGLASGFDVEAILIKPVARVQLEDTLRQLSLID